MPTQTLTAFQATDDVTDNTAARHNRLVAGALYAEFANTESLSATKELADSDCWLQVLTASTTNRTCELAPEATTNHHFLIVNAGGSNNIVVKDDSGTTTYATLEPGEWCFAIPSGSLWYVIDSNSMIAPPFTDANAIIKGSADTSKQLRFEVDGFTASATRVLTPPNYDGTIATLAGTETLTNKRVTRRISSEASNATPSINCDNVDCHQITALAAAITSITITGTPTDGQELDLEILDNGTARAITHGASCASGPATLATTTVLSKWLYEKLRYSSSRSKWICMAVGSEQ